VLRVHVVRGSGVDYYVADLVPGRAEGSAVAGESPGVWTGRGTSDLGLRGTVEGPEFAGVLAGRDPSGERALRQVRGARPVSGFDLVFAAPKSVSVLHLLAHRELGAATGGAHRAAVADALGYLEGSGIGARRTERGSVHHVATTGAVAADFVHRTSRALDPHLHTHLVVANVVRGVDGRWSALDSRRLFLHRRAARSVYDASLRHHLGRAAGVSWLRTPSGGWEVAGVDPVLCRLFSQRTASMDEAAHRLSGGHGSTAQRRVAFHADRPAKDRAVTADELRTGWRRRASSFGLDTGALVSVVGRRPPTDPARAVDTEALADRLALLARDRTRVGVRDLVEAVADASPYGLDGPGVRRAAVAVGEAAGPGVGPVHGDGIWSPAAVVRAMTADGGVVARAVGDTGLGPERRVTRQAEGEAAHHRGVADDFGADGRRPPGRQR
jgi:conjugative relaxase-like TrwC/TraI family protein